MVAGWEWTGSDRCLIEGMRCWVLRVEKAETVQRLVTKVYPGQATLTMLRWVRSIPCRVHSRLLLRTGGRKAEHGASCRYYYYYYYWCWY